MKYFFFLVLAFTLSVTACKKDKDPDAIQLTSANVQGTWNLTEATVDSEFALGTQGQFIVTTNDASLSNIAMTVTFNADGTWTSMGTATATLVTTEPGEAPETETDQLTNGIGSGNYGVTNGKLSMTGLELAFETEEDEPLIFDVKSFQPDSKLDISNFLKETGMDPVLGLDVIFEATTNLKFAK